MGVMGQNSGTFRLISPAPDGPVKHKGKDAGGRTDGSVALRYSSMPLPAHLSKARPGDLFLQRLRPPPPLCGAMAFLRDSCLAGRHALAGLSVGQP
jgi:hypothetical protein